MANIGFLLTMTGIAAAGGAIDAGTGFVTAMAMLFAGAWLMWLFREEDEDGEDWREGIHLQGCKGIPGREPGEKGKDTYTV